MADDPTDQEQKKKSGTVNKIVTNELAKKAVEDTVEEANKSVSSIIPTTD